MIRTWATGSAHDDKPLDWLFDLRYDKDVAHIRDAIEAGLDDASVGACQTALLACECVAFARGGPADLHDDATAWMKRAKPPADDELVAIAVKACERIASDSALLAWWKQVHDDQVDEWLESVAFLAERVQHREEPAPAFDDAFPHLQLTILPEEPNEPIAMRQLAPGLTLVMFYARPDEDPHPVPAAHVRAWDRPVMAAVAKRMRAEAEFKIDSKLGVTCVFGRNQFCCGLAAFVDLFFEGEAPHGVLVGMPFAGAVLFHKIVDKGWYDAAKVLIENIQHLHDSPDPISTELFWWRGPADLVAQPYELGEETFTFAPSPELLDAVSSL